MLPLDFADLPLPAVAAAFVVAALAVWFAGTRLSGYADELSIRTGIGGALIGALMLGGITSLPELATSLTASLAGDADMAVNNLFGGIAMQVAVLAVADAAVGGPLSTLARAPVVMLQAALLIILLGIAMGGMIVGEPAGAPVGLWSAAMVVTALGAFALFRPVEGDPSWRAVEAETPRPGSVTNEPEPPGEPPPSDDPRPLRSTVIRAAVAALVILAAGYAITRAGESIAERTGLGSSFVGAALVAASTSLPEVSTTIAAVRLGRYDIAFSNIFGANILDGGLVFIVDLAYDGPPVLGLVDDFALLAALLGIIVTAVYLASIIRGRVHSLGRMGIDSIAVLALYFAGLYALFTMR